MSSIFFRGIILVRILPPTASCVIYLSNTHTHTHIYIYIYVMCVSKSIVGKSYFQPTQWANELSLVYIRIYVVNFAALKISTSFENYCVQFSSHCRRIFPITHMECARCWLTNLFKFWRWVLISNRKQDNRNALEKEWEIIKEKK